MKRWLPLALAAAAMLAQERTPEQEELSRSLAEAGSSQVDFARALERHLAKYPQSPQRAEIERALAKAAVELRDSRRAILYGERVLAREPENIEMLERVSRHLLPAGDKESCRRALDYASRLASLIREMPLPQAGTPGAAKRAEEQWVILGKALVYQARARGNLGGYAEAEKLARQSFDVFPSAESAREIARWLDKQGHTSAALVPLAEAFMIGDPNKTEDDRAKDRARLGEWARKMNAPGESMAPLLLAAYDRTQTVIAGYKARLKALDPNAEVADPMDYIISGVNGEKLALARFKGKVVVMDFWATWCAPCRAQQPLYEQVAGKFKGNPNVVLLNINTDENRQVVKPFLDQEGWKKTIYFEDGLSALLRVSSIPTTVVVSPKGEITSRMNGFVPERFVDMLSERIKEALEAK